MNKEQAIEIIKNGGVGVLPTDTLYGLVASAFHQPAVERIYDLKERDTSKALIVLIGDFSDLETFGISLSHHQKDICEREWPGQVSIILPCSPDKFSYIHRGNNSIAFRLPADLELRSFLHKTGPLVAPSANPEGKSPAKNIEQVKEYFDENVDFYLDGGERAGNASKLISLKEGGIKVLRE
jgi:L-threonylcarbamoyladenylate synthase